MSQPSKRFVLPYEPEYTAHRTDQRVERAMRLHRLARQQVTSPDLVPDEAAASGSSRRDRAGELQRSGLLHKD